MSRRTLICILLLLIMLATLATACIDGSGGAGGKNEASANSTPVPQYIQATLSADATATFGAQEFYAQLTAIAEEKNRP
jgi:ABC-type oligopeptide transport system substrate-binding subunit